MANRIKAQCLVRTLILFAVLSAIILAGVYPVSSQESSGVPAIGPVARVRAAADERRWVWQNPLPQGNNLNSVFFVDARIGWTVGDAGTILKTTDGGVTWVQQASGTTNELYAVTFVDAMNGWAVEQNEAILKTTDGGVNWTSKRPVLPVQIGTLTSVAFADSQTGWIVGYVPNFPVSTIIKTSDGGITWTLGPRGFGPLLSIAFVDARTGWAVGVMGRILHTEDGGNTWQDQSMDTGGDFKGVSFVDAMTGWVVGDTYKGPGLIFKTTDGGKNWTLQSSSDTTPGLSEVTFINSSVGWAAGIGAVLRTANGGETWEQRPASGSRPPNTVALYSVYFVDATNGWAVGRYGIIVRTSDGGATWAEQSSHAAANALGAVRFGDVYTGWAVGDRILKTTDGGATWEPQPSPTARGLLPLTFVGPSTGWIVGDVGTILKTTNGGTTWI